MKNHWLFKALCIVLAMLSGAMIVVGSVGLALSDSTGYVTRCLQIEAYNTGYRVAGELSSAIVGNYAQKKSGLGKKFFRSYVFWNYSEIDPNAYDFDYRLMDEKERTLENTMGDSSQYAHFSNWQFAIPVADVKKLPPLPYHPEYEQYMQMVEQEPDRLETELKDFPPLYPGTYSYAYAYENQGSMETVYRLDFYQTDNYSIEIGMTQEQLAALNEDNIVPGLLPGLFAEYDLSAYVTVIAVSAAVLLASIVGLCAMAGKRPGTSEIRAGGLNCLPLDLYLVVAVVCVIFGIMSPTEGCRYGIYQEGFEAQLWLMSVAACGMLASGAAALVFMALTAQIRQGNRFWLRNSICGRLLYWLAHSGRRALGWMGRKLRAFWSIAEEPLRNLPMTWQWLIVFGVLWLLFLIAVLVPTGFGVVLLLFLLPIGAAAVFYVSGAFGKLHESARDMAKGDLDTKIATDGIWFQGCFGEFAQDLNTLGDTCMEAARRQMKSERMKSELITNVSHDIKTPLTSIINYVDLLRSAETEQQRQEYLEVLDRQSQRLKKLIEDLMEMSKVSSGNIAAEVVPTDVTEAVGQALGEFSDRLSGKNLHVVQKIPQDPLMAAADGKLLWRVLSNILSNVVKYAMPGTRVYVDVEKRDSHVQISVKNISAEILNISAEELMDRFVRGDASRNTEGNGLGLNIAKGLMEAQHGTLELGVDGDLFKVVLTLQLSAIRTAANFYEESSNDVQ